RCRSLRPYVRPAAARRNLQPRGGSGAARALPAGAGPVRSSTAMNTRPLLTPFNLGAILLSLALVGAPHASHLPAWITVFGAVTLVARFWLGWKNRPLPNRWLLIAVALACVVGIALSYRTLYGR